MDDSDVPGLHRSADGALVTALGSSVELVRPRLRALMPSLQRMPEIVLVAGVIALIVLVHAFNMSNFPYYENDEGIYISQAWAAVNQGQLAPYTYYYDHAPAGWLQIAIWSILSGGFYSFGTSIESGRVFMLIVQLGSTGLVYLLARRMTGSVLLSVLAALIFGLSAYGIYYHRRVLLDNLATFWLLASLAILMRRRLGLNGVWAAALAIGLSILSKEPIIFLVPAMGLFVWLRVHPAQRVIATVGWFVIVGSIVSVYVLMAVLKGELFPAPFVPGQQAAHVSLLGTLAEQAARGRDGGLLEAGSQFWTMALQWAGREPLLIVGGTASAVLAVIRLPWRREAGALGLMTLSLWLFIGRGGIVLEFYAIPLLPLLALNVVLALDALRAGVGWLAPRILRRPAIPERGMVMAASIALVVAVLPGYVSEEKGFARDPLILWRGQEATAQRQALDWVRAHLPANAAIAIDRYLWTDLQAPPDQAEPAFTLAHDYWRIDADPYIRVNVFEDNWRNFDYLVFSVQLTVDVEAEDLTFLSEILDHSTPVATFDTGGWPIYVNKVVQEDIIEAVDDPLLGRAWQDYVDRFIEADGRVVDPQLPDRGTTSEGQAYALLRAAYMDDRATFDLVWRWTSQNLQARPDALLSWRWGGDNGSVVDPASASDADVDAALALLFASQIWPESTYADDANALLVSVWEHLTQEIAGDRVLVAGDWAQGDAHPIINPSYFAPYAFRIFAEADPGRPWMELVDSSYAILERWADGEQLGAPVGAIPNWLAIDAHTGDLRLATGRVRSADEFSYDASRLAFRLGLDWVWFGEPRALEAMSAIDLPLRELREKGRLAAAYRLDGAPAVDYEAASMYAGALPLLLAADLRDVATRIHTERILGPALDERSREWDSYYTQNWAWFATALMDGGMANLWAEETTAPWRPQQ